MFEAQFTVFVLVFPSLKLNWILYSIRRTEIYFLSVGDTCTERRHEKMNKETARTFFNFNY